MPPGRVERSAWSIDSFVPTHSSTRSAPMPPVSSRTRVDAGIPPLLDDVRGAELARERLALRVPRHRDDRRRAEPLRGDDRAQSDGAVADDRDRVARADTRRDGGVVPGAHDVAEGQESRGSRRRATGPVDDGERAVGQRDADALALAAVGEAAEAVVAAPPSAAEARGADAVAAVHARAVAHVERGDHEVAGLDVSHVGADLLDDADELVADAVRLVGRRDASVRPEVGAADAGGDDADDGVGAGREDGVGDFFDADVAGGVDDGGEHATSLGRGDRRIAHSWLGCGSRHHARPSALGTVGITRSKDTT